jgi:predicted nucleic acid-binding Zn ribbon protein
MKTLYIYAKTVLGTSGKLVAHITEKTQLECLEQAEKQYSDYLWSWTGTGFYTPDNRKD